MLKQFQPRTRVGLENCYVGPPDTPRAGDFDDESPYVCVGIFDPPLQQTESHPKVRDEKGTKRHPRALTHAHVVISGKPASSGQPRA